MSTMVTTQDRPAPPPRPRDALPSLPLGPWEATRATLHLYAQVVGKVRLASMPWRNQWWHVPLYVTAQGLTTGRMCLAEIDYQIDFDFLGHRLVVRLCTGESDGLDLHDGLSVRDFYLRLMTVLARFGLDPEIRPRAYRMPYSQSLFVEDTVHASYDPVAVSRYWQGLRWVDGVLSEFAGRFRGKQSPPHLFWHGFDLAMTRFSGRLAPPRADADRVTRAAYDEEVISFGFWPGDPTVREATLYAYAAPEPVGLASRPLAPRGARWVDVGGSHTAHLAFEAVRTAANPKAAALEFLESAYQAGAEAARWDIERLADPWTMRDR